MLLFLLAYLGGVLTIVSPCILPVLPFVFARADRPFLKSGLPMLVGMALTFALVATLGGGRRRLGRRGQRLRPHRRADRAVRSRIDACFSGAVGPADAAAGRARRRLSQSAEQRRRMRSIWPSLLLGIATGLLWAPCAGPDPRTDPDRRGARRAPASGPRSCSLAYAAGAATSLALALAGRRPRLRGDEALARRRRMGPTRPWRRRAGRGRRDRSGARYRLSHAPSLAQHGLVGAAPARQLRAFEQNAAASEQRRQVRPMRGLAGRGPMPSLDGAREWLNSPPLTRERLRARSCWSISGPIPASTACARIPYVRAWAEKYKDQGLVVIGVHAPEFAFEKNVGNVKSASRR